MSCFPTFVFPFLSSKSDVLRLMAPVITINEGAKSTSADLVHTELNYLF